MIKFKQLLEYDRKNREEKVLESSGKFLVIVSSISIGIFLSFIFILCFKFVTRVGLHVTVRFLFNYLHSPFPFYGFLEWRHDMYFILFWKINTMLKCNSHWVQYYNRELNRIKRKYTITRKCSNNIYSYS